MKSRQDRQKLPPAFNLPCKFVLHTVGPIVGEQLTQTDCELLSSCYKACLDLAQSNGVSSIAFCCISTGVFRFPQEKAAERYETFLQTRNIIGSSAQQKQQTGDGNVLFLELGVGRNTPGIIKYPFWQMTAKNPNARYACINFGEAFVPYEIEKQSICLDGDIGEILKEIDEDTSKNSPSF